MWFMHLSLRNFRNYRSLDADLEPGLVVVTGDNAQGKTNLLEALYLLSVMKSFRVPTERDLVNWQAAEEGEAATVTAVVQGREGRLRVHVALQPMAASTTTPVPDRGGPQVTVQKHVRLNGAPRSAADAVGRVNAVLFSAADLDVVLGPPSLRRRYLDVLLCQLDRHYLRTLQRYQRVLAHRNHLLRQAREGRPGVGEELAFWDGELVGGGSYIVQRRREVTRDLGHTAREVHALLGEGEVVEMEYQSTLQVEGDDLEEARAAFQRALQEQHGREMAQGMTVVGPHRDDLVLRVQGMPLASHGSRGQARTLALALRLAEAEMLASWRGEGPILLLDDVLSELDARRRGQVMERVQRYDQVIVTTADETQVGEVALARATRLRVEAGVLMGLEHATSP